MTSAKGQSSVRGWGLVVFDSAWNDATGFVEHVLAMLREPTRLDPT